MEIAAFVISILSLFVAFLMPIYEQYRSKKVNDINLNSEYLKDIYIKYLTDKIPNARKLIRFNDDKLSDVAELANAFQELLHQVYFFKYIDEEFYAELKIYIQDLEDSLSNDSGMKFSDEEKEKFNESLEEKVTNIYSILNNKYKNG